MNQVLITIGVILNATLMYTPPLLFAALGSCFSEKSGVVNIGLEGMIVIGAFTGAAVGHFVDAPWLAFLCAGLAGGLLALLHAFATVTCQADQTISGTAINFLASGLSVYICFLLFRTSETMPVKSKLPASSTTCSSGWAITSRRARQSCSGRTASSIWCSTPTRPPISPSCW